MAKGILGCDRRQLLGAFAATSLAAILPRTVQAEGPQQVKLEATAGTLSLRPGGAQTPVWSLQPEINGVSPVLRLRSGGRLDVALHNALGVPVVPDWRGIDGAPSGEPLLAQRALAPGGQARSILALPRGGGTAFCDLRLLADGEERPSRPLPVVVEEATAAGTADRDEVFLVEDWRLRTDGTAVPPGIEAGDAATIYTVNGRIRPDFAVRHNERLRFRFINGCQRAVLALKIENHEVRVMALDGEPAEPFFARSGALVLAPGGRADCFIDVMGQPDLITQIALHDGKEARSVARLVMTPETPARPLPLPPAPVLPANGLPAELDLTSALRVELTLNGSGWTKPASFATSMPAFHARARRVVVLALVNRSDIATVFHLHGHHFRLLDRLDDGWKPFWLDTLAVEPGQTQRIAFLAEHAGRYLLESTATDWAAPKLVRWYAVE
jgi:FtsP/CotA-like multicopper oxidase with cupredoxin domain